MTWGLGDPVASEGWGASTITMITRLLPHIQQFVRVRQTLVRAEAGSTTVTASLDNPRIGVLQLERCGRILVGNDRAHSMLRHGDGLCDRDGVLGARAPADQVRLERLVRGAAGLWRGRGQRVDGAPPLVRVAAVRNARQAGGPPLNRTTAHGTCPRWC